MADNALVEKPCQVPARQGFSVLYKEKYLYSKYNPQQALKNYIEKLHILPETLILAYSPAAWFCLDDLQKILPENCFILGIEFDENLYEFSKNFLSENCSGKNISSVLLKNPEEIASILDEGKIVPPEGTFRRCAVIEMSGGTALHAELFKRTTEIADDSIGRFWKNRLTLLKLGRLYNSNIFKNLKNTAKAEPIEKGSIDKVFLVFGAGPSVDGTIKSIHQLVNKHRNQLCIIAADAAALALQAHKITPDIVIGVESQFAIEKAYIGLKKDCIHFITDLTSRPECAARFDSTSFIATKYANSVFVDSLLKTTAELKIPVFRPLGSVGLYAVETALFLRKDADTPVIFTGLDFSYPAGKTHCRETPQHKARLLYTDRFHPIANYEASFSAKSLKLTGKDGNQVITEPALLSYAKLFSVRYKNTANLFDISEEGLNLGAKRLGTNALREYLEHSKGFSKTDREPVWTTSGNDTADNTSTGAGKNTDAFIKAHHEKLIRIKEILTSANGTNDKTKKELEALLTECSYLYMHFPDAAKGLSMTESFLKRIRAELNYFIKITR